MRCQSAGHFTGSQVPQLDRAIPRPGGKCGSPRRKRHGGHPILMSLQSSDQITGSAVPQLDRAIPGPGGESGAVREGEGDRTDRVPMPSQRGERLSGTYVPQPDIFIPESRRSHSGPIGGEGHGTDPIPVGIQSSCQAWGDLREGEPQVAHITLRNLPPVHQSDEQPGRRDSRQRRMESCRHTRIPRGYCSCRPSHDTP